MVTRVGKFVGGLGVDVTNIANAHATENRLAIGAAMNPTANLHVLVILILLLLFQSVELILAGEQ